VPSYVPTDAKGNPLPRTSNEVAKGIRGGVRLIDPNTGELLGWLRRDPPRGVTHAFVSADGKTVAMQEYQRGKTENETLLTAALWDLQTRKPQADVPNKGLLYGYSPDGKTLVIREDNKSILWDVEAKKERASLTGTDEHMGRCVFSRDGTTLVGQLYTREGLRIVSWEVASGKQLRKWEPSMRQVYSFVLSPDGSQLAIVRGRNSSRNVEPCDVTIWDVKTGKLVLTLHGHVNDVLAVDYHPEGKLLATGGSDGTVRLWDLTKEVSARR
jgi:WD40 repeat protein